MIVNDCTSRIFTMVNGVMTGKTLRLRFSGCAHHDFERETGSKRDINGCKTRVSPWVVYPPHHHHHHHHHHICHISFNFLYPTVIQIFVSPTIVATTRAEQFPQGSTVASSCLGYMFQKQGNFHTVSRGDKCLSSCSQRK